MGLKVPTNITEWGEAFKAFKEQDANGDPNDEIPLSAIAFNHLGQERSFVGMFALGFGMKDKGYPYDNDPGELGLTAKNWCVQYCTWLMKAAGCSSYPNYSDYDKVSEAINYFTTNGNYGLRDSKVPAKGDWVFYMKTGSTASDPEAYYAHAGFVVDVIGDIVTTVEGNLSNTIKSPREDDYNYKTATNIGGNGCSVLGFATPTWI